MNLNLMTPLGYTGYGIAGLNILKSFIKAGVQISLFPIGQPSVTDKLDVDIIKQCINKANFYDYSAPCLKIWHQFDLAQRVGHGTYFAFPFFELDKFNKTEQHSLFGVDHLFVTSQWAERIVKKHIIKDDKGQNVGNPPHINVIPLGIDKNIFSLESAKHVKNKNNKNVFVIVNIGKWERRKGHDIIPIIFEKAFTKNDNVELWMFPYNPFLNAQEISAWEQEYKYSKLCDKIWIFPRQNTHEELRDYMASADIGFFPSRAEGWNLELLEMMALGKHVITTNYSAHTEYCNDTNCNLIKIDKLEVANDNKWFHGQGNWAYIGDSQIEQSVEYLRQAYKAWQENPESTNYPGTATAQYYTWDRTAKLIIENIKKYEH